jgi:prepilin peptidase CpaA
MNTASVLLGGAAIALAGTAAVTDVRTGRIPNRLTMGALALAPALAFSVAYLSQGASAGIAALGACGLGTLCTSLVPLALFVRGELGGGDVKLLAASGALLGPFVGFNALALGLIFASLFAVARAALRGQFRALVMTVLRIRRGPVSEVAKARVFAQETLRLGPAFFAGTVTAVFFGPHALISW